MDSGELVVASEALIRIFVVLLYTPICLVVYFRLFPRLSTTSRRLAFGMLTAQALVIVLALEIRPKSNFEHWLWNLDQEWNIPSTLASTQLALVAGVALLTAWLARAVPVWQRLYLVGIGLVFLFLAWDEYFIFHERIRNWEKYYVALGGVVAATTAIALVRSHRHTRIWHLMLLLGLAMGAFGAMAFETQREICESWGFLRLDGCLWTYNFEESLELLGMWLALVGVLGMFSKAAPTPRPLVRRILYGLPALWILLLIHDPLIFRLELQFLAIPANVELESGAHVHGHRTVSGDGGILVQLYASTRQRDYIGLGYSVHLVDQVSGESYASRDKYAGHQLGVLVDPDFVHVYRQLMEVRNSAEDLDQPRSLDCADNLARARRRLCAPKGALQRSSALGRHASGPGRIGDSGGVGRVCRRPRRGI